MDSSSDLVRLWPAAGVRVRSGDLELRWIDDELLLDLAAVAARGVHDPGTMPFEHPWTRGTPDEVARSVLAYQWDARARVSPSKLVLELGVLADGVPVGVQGLVADDWHVLRRAQTGSWLGIEHHGRGIGQWLVREGLARASADGWQAVFVVGDPRYYRRFGFDAGAAARLRTPYDGPHMMALALAGALPAGGAIVYPAAFSRLL